MNQLLTWIWDSTQGIGSIGTAIGVFLAYFSLRANHDWNRRQQAINIAEKWNTETLRHRKAIENIMPGLVDIDSKSNKVVEITKRRASQIYLSNPNIDDQKSDWELRFHFIELLNYFEDVSLVYIHRAGDRKILEEAFRGPLIRWYEILKPFMQVVEENRGYDPWAPFTDLINIWKQPKRKLRRKTS